MIVKPLILTIGVCLAYKLQCPLPAQWNIKARALCSDPSKYYCLPDDIAKELTENCTRSDYRRAGLRIVIRGDWDIDYCSDDFYQPAPIVYYTNLTSDCIMKKSLCKEEGQVLYKNGSPSDDVSCTCDHTNGYAFIEKPKQLHHCVPSQEDCSCYRKACQNDSYVLNSDFECILSGIDQVQHSPPTTAKILIERPARQNENNYIINYEQEYALLKCIKVIILVTLLIGGGFLIAICFFDEELYSFIESCEDQPTTIFTMSFKLNENWQPTYADNNSSEYKELIARINDDFIRLYREDNFYKSNFRDFEVRCVRSGSINVESIVSMKMAILTKDMYQDTLNLLKAEQAKPDSTLTIISAVITDSLVVIGHNDKPSTAFESEEGSLPMYTDEKNSEYKDLSEKIEKDYPLTEQKIGLLVDRVDELNFALMDLLGEYAERSKRKSRDSLVDTVDELHFALIDLLDEHAERARRKSRDLLDEELRLVIVGKNGVGKRTTANTIMGKNHFPAGSLHTSVTQKCTQGYTTVIGKPMQVIVTPGIFAFKDKEKEIEAEMKRCIHMAAPGPHAILLVIEYGHFTSEDYDLIETFLEYFGEELMEYVIIVFSHIDKMESSHTLEKMIDEDPRLKQLIKECGNRYCKINNMGNSTETQRQIACIFAMIKAFPYTDHMIQKAEKNVREKEKKLTENIIKDGQKMYPEVIRELKKKFKTESEQENNYMNEYERLKEEIQAEYEQKLIQVREYVRKEFEKSTSVLADLNW